MRTIAIVLLITAACDGSPDRVDIADQIDNHAAPSAAHVTIGGGKFVNVEFTGTQAECDDLQHWARQNIKQPPDCVRVKCILADGSEDSIVSYDGYWNGIQGGGYFPKCAK